MTNRPKSNDTPIACTASDLAQAADSLLKMLPAGLLTKSKILNVFAARIAGSRHDWGYIKSSDAIISQSLQAEPDLARMLRLDDTPSTSKSETPSVIEATNDEYPRVVDAFLGSANPIAILRGQPGIGLFSTLKERAEALDIDVREIRLGSLHPDAIVDYSEGKIRLKSHLRPRDLGGSLTVYDDLDYVPDVALKALAQELVEIRGAKGRVRVAITSKDASDVIVRLHSIAPDVVDQAFHVAVQPAIPPQMRLLPAHHRMRDRHEHLRGNKMLANNWPIAEVAAVDTKLVVAFADPVTRKITQRSMPRRALRDVFELKADERINVSTKDLKIAQYVDDIVEVRTTIGGRPCVQTLERSELLAAIKVLKPVSGLYPGDIDKQTGVALADFQAGKGVISIILRPQHPHTGELLGPRVTTLAKPVVAELMQYVLRGLVEVDEVKEKGLAHEYLKVKAGSISIAPRDGLSFIHDSEWDITNRVNTEELFNALMKAIREK